MPNILTPRHLHALARFAASNVLVAFDYDGTLAPIVADPARARMRASTARLLRSVAERYPCAAISGRMRADLVHLVETIPFRHVAGNHGIEPWGETRAFRVAGAAVGRAAEAKARRRTGHRASRTKRTPSRFITAAPFTSATRSG